MTEKTNIDDIIGIVKTEEKTNSVELKKEYYKNQSKDKRFKLSMLPLQNIRDDKEPLSQQEVVDLLNEQEELIKRLKTIREEQTETILKQKRKMQELEERNKRQYNRLKELTELMYERQWGKLENMIEEWEKQDELLQKEWHNYGDL